MITEAPDRIQLLDPHTVNQIAAGEVVERPASVVKELVENALDAGATRVDIELRDSGRSLIRVSDNGCGMNSRDLVSALQRHATSKISSSADLLEVASLGFRGEALPSIASVSRMSIASAAEDGLRAIVRVEGGEVQPVEGLAGPKGTEVTVEDLFFNTPARLKFLKSDTTELGQAIEHISKYAIAYPHVAFRMAHNGQEVLQTSGSGDMPSAVADVWGREAARALAGIEMEVGGLRLHGLVSPPHFTKATRAFQYIFVNGRPVRTRTLTAAIDQSFRDITPDRRFPLLVLMLEIDPNRIDVNVSPTKSEVKFQQEGQAFEAIRLAIKSTLMHHGMIPDAAKIVAANEALGQTSVPRPFFGGPSPSLGVGPLGIGMVAESLLAPPAPTDQSAMPGLAGWPWTEMAASPEFPAAIPAPESSQNAFHSLLDGLRILGQVMNTFIIAENKQGFMIIDQHVAHERILFEYLCGVRGRSSIETQTLLVPQTLELDRRSAVLLQEKLPELREIGFDIEPFGGESYVVRAVPAALRTQDPLRMLKDLVEELVDSSVTRKLIPTREQLWITTACKMSIKAGDPLSIAEMERLIVDLAATENPYLCPHGRPITLTLSKDALMRMFKRS